MHHTMHMPLKYLQMVDMRCKMEHTEGQTV